MNNFRDIQFPPNYKYASDSEYKPFEFYSQVIPLSVKIDLKLGYFTTYSISILAVPFSKFILSNGVFRIITCHVLNKKDKENIIAPFELSEEELEEIDTIFNHTPERLKEILIEGRQLFYNCLCYLQNKNRLIIQPVFFQNEMGLAHSKNGVFYDGQNKLSIDGSCNFTPSGLLLNDEEFKVTRSWRDNEDAMAVEFDEEKIESILQGKHRDYIHATKEKLIGIISKKSNTIDELAIVERGEILLRKIEDFYEKNERGRKINIFLENIFQDKINELKRKSLLPFIPNWFLNEEEKLRQHQESAIHNWFKNNCKGIFNMATGAGKTVTALSCLVRLLNNKKFEHQNLFIVITAPFLHLINQWQEEAVNFNIETIGCFGQRSKWEKNLKWAINNLNHQRSKYVCAVVSNKTFSSNHFIEVIQNVKTNFCLIADEMHNLGSPKTQISLKKISPNIRIGLSATPERHLDFEGTEFLFNYFGGEIFFYGIKEAIRDKTLVPYNYYPILIELQDKEKEDYVNLSINIGKCFKECEKDSSKKEKLKILLLARSRLIANANNKIPKLQELLKHRVDSCYNLVYCGDEIQFDDNQNDSNEQCISEARLISQVERIRKILGQELDMHVEKFTAKENLKKRKNILERFEKGSLQTLVAIRCLDEGVDVKRTETAYILASSSNPRQYIQRRGRVLRQSDGKKIAAIYDFIVLPELNIEDEYFNINRGLVEKELKRVSEFASSASNSGHGKKILFPYKKKYNLLNY